MIARPLRKIAVLPATAILTIVALSQPAWAVQLAHEGFTLSFPTYAAGGTGFSGPWSGFGYTLLPKSLCFRNLAASGGGSVAGSSAFASRNLSGPLGGTVYLSFLIQPLSEFAGQFSFFGMALFGSTGSLFIGKPGASATDQYVIEDFGGANQVASGTEVAVKRTALLVVKLQFEPGPDVVTLFVNPIPGRPEPSGNVVKTNLDLGTVSALSIISTGATSAIDEIRVGTTFADVVPGRNKEPGVDFVGCLPSSSEGE